MPKGLGIRPTVDFWEWQELALCRGREELFYHQDAETKGERRRKEREAVAICHQCPVMLQCRRHALAAGELYGVWGGLTEMDRHRILGRHRSG